MHDAQCCDKKAHSLKFVYLYQLCVDCVFYVIYPLWLLYICVSLMHVGLHNNRGWANLHTIVFWEQRQLRLIPFLYVHRSVPVKSAFRISLWKISLFYWILTGTNNKSCSQFCVVLSNLKIWLWSVISITTFSEVFPKWFLIFKWENMAAVLWQLLFCSLIFPMYWIVFSVVPCRPNLHYLEQWSLHPLEWDRPEWCGGSRSSEPLHAWLVCPSNIRERWLPGCDEVLHLAKERRGKRHEQITAVHTGREGQHQRLGL